MADTQWRAWLRRRTNNLGQLLFKFKVVDLLNWLILVELLESCFLLLGKDFQSVGDSLRVRFLLLLILYFDCRLVGQQRLSRTQSPSILLLKLVLFKTRFEPTAAG